MRSLSSIQDWKDFERLCADLLQAEGFHIESEPSVDTTGADIVATYDYRSHGHGIPPIRVRWRVQCKHLAVSGNHLSRPDVERALLAFDAVRGVDDGLLLMISSDYTEPAREVIRKFTELRPGVKVAVWNQRQLIDLLDRHGHLQRRYGLESAASAAERMPVPEVKASGPVLFVSDQSALAHECAAYLRQAGVEIVFLPHWNYSDTARLELFRETYADTVFGLCICFLGDSFGLPFPPELETTLVRAVRRGTPLLLFPFAAWLVAQGGLGRLSSFIPVRLRSGPRDAHVFSRTQLFAERRKGDYRWKLVEGSFEEDEYREYVPLDGSKHFTVDQTSRIGVSHSFEYLSPIPGANVAWADASGNPLVVLASVDSTKVAYFNTCCHSCLSSLPVPSPMRSSNDFETLFANVVRWLVDRSVPVPLDTRTA